MRFRAPWFLLVLALSTLGAAEVAVEGPAWLGVYLGESRDGGVAILGVVAGGPAQSGGLQTGDLLVSLDTVAITSVDAVAAFLRRTRPGTEVVAGIVRGGEPRERTLSLAAPPGARWRAERSDAERARAEALQRAASWTRRLSGLSGLSLVGIPAELREHYGAPADAGALVTAVETDSVAQQAGLGVGDVLIRIGDRAITSPQDLPGALTRVTSAETLEIEVVRARERLVLRLELQPIAVPDWDGGETGDGVAISIRTKLLENELKRLEQRMRAIRQELERLKGTR